MLSRLSISNYALIDTLDFQPGKGLSIITGETGAGKSVMMGALGMLKGERADSKVISDKSKKSVVEAVFEDIDSLTAAKVSEMDSEWDGKELFLRREILPSGRSRAFVNDSPATLAQLSEISRRLLDIHSQNSNSLLTQERMQLRLIDSVAENEKMLEAYEKEFRRYVALRQQIKRMKEESVRLRDEAEIITFRLNQLDKLKPKGGELKKIETRYDTLSNSEEIREKLGKARNFLIGEGRGALDAVEDAASLLRDIDFSVFDEETDLAERLSQCIIEIKDVAETVDSVLGDIEYDPATIAYLSGRMQAYYSAFKTFRVESDEELERLHNEVKLQYATLENEGAGTGELEKEAKTVAGKLKEMAASISEKRRHASITLQEEIERDARTLGLENLNFKIEIVPAKLSRTGGDKVEFKAAFNKNQPLLGVGLMASGGEMARLMLAVKKITSLRLSLPTVIFDEIDTGVSGPIADRMGEMMKDMGDRMQILTITHLPQVAAKGNRHFKVYKEDRDDKTVSDVMLLSEVDREKEIARMLSGEKINEAALSNARSLLGKAQ